jgi:hypothetical protein
MSPVILLLAKLRKSLRIITLWRLYSCDTLLERLTSHFEDMSRALGEFIEKEDPVVGQRHLTRCGYLTAADQPHSGHGVVGGAERPGGDDGGAPPGEAGDAMDAGGVNGFG